MRKLTKAAAVVAPAIMALAAATPAKAGILLMAVSYTHLTLPTKA